MARNSFNININLKGFPNANQQLKRTSKGMDEMRVQTTGLVRKIGALRNRILVFTFAIGGATLVINKFVGAAAGFESVKARLVGLTGSVEKADAAFKRFSAVAGTTPFQLQDVVNAGAQLEAFGLNANATLSSVTDLAAFMGTTATEAANALGRAFAGGVGAADMLRDKGIRQIIQDSQGIEDITKLTLPQFRKALISALTDPDGRISGSAERLSNTYEGAVSNMKDALTNFTAMIGGLLLPSLTESVKGAEEFVRAFDKKEIAEAATAISIVATTFGVYATGVRLATLSNLLFAKSMKRLGLMGLAIILATVIDKIFELMGTFSHLNEGLNDYRKELEQSKKDQEKYLESLDDVISSLSDATNEEKGYTEVLQKKADSLTNQLMVITNASEKTIALANSTGLLSNEDFKLIKRINELTGAIEREKVALERLEERKKLSLSVDSDINRSIRLLSVARNSENNKLEENIEKETRRLDLISEIQSALDLSANAILPFINGLDLMNTELTNIGSENEGFSLATGQTISFGTENNKLVSSLILAAQALQDYDNVVAEAAESNSALSSLQSKFNSVLMSTTEGEIKHLNALILKIEANTELIATDKERTLVLEELKNKIAELEEGEPLKDMADNSHKVANGILAASRAMVSLRDSSEITQGQILQTVGAMMMLFPGGQIPGAVLQSAGMFTGHTGGLIKNDGIQRFATGGMVQGQDNVPIMAQAGEFIMQRSAVQNIGVQNLADMNRSGQGGGVTVNIQGNMIGNDEFVRDTLIPQLSKASSQGLA